MLQITSDLVDCNDASGVKIYNRAMLNDVAMCIHSSKEEHKHNLTIPISKDKYDCEKKNIYISYNATCANISLHMHH